MNMKIALSVAATALTTFSTTYVANPAAPIMAYAAAIGGAVGAYLLGLYQRSPRAK
jgi:membrane associated rhomboid family serine protease